MWGCELINFYLVVVYYFFFIYSAIYNLILSYLTVLSYLHVVLLGEGRAVSACPVSVPHSPGEGVYRAGSRPEGRAGGPGGWLRGGWRGDSSSTGAERLYSLLT